MQLTVNNVAEFVARVLELSSGRPDVLYRGLSNKDYVMIPSIGRYTAWGDNSPVPPQALAEREFEALEQFRLASIPFTKGRDGNMLETMIRAQHHGVPTRLLDWTSNPLVALYFASRSTKKTADGAVYMSTPPKSFRDAGGDSSKPLQIVEDCVLAPQHIDARITAQASIFTLMAKPFSPLPKIGMVEISFPAKARGLIFAELDALGIHAESMFPGLTGLAEHIKQKAFGAD